MSHSKWFGGLMGGLLVLASASPARASHFRYGHLRYSIPDPVNKPLEVQFDFTVGWHPNLIGTAVIDYGDGTASPALTGTPIHQGFGATSSYVVYEFTTTHTYAAPSMYTAFYTDCCRTSTLTNAADKITTISALVDVTPGNLGNAGTQIPPIVQMQTAGIRTLHIPAIDNTPGATIACRFATPIESGDAGTIMPPLAEVTNNAPTLATVTNPPGCLLTWDLNGTNVARQYAVQIAMESNNNLNGNLRRSVVDFTIETVNSPPPDCSPSTDFVVDIGQLVQTDVIGTHSNSSALLTSAALGSMLGLTPVAGTAMVQPFSSTFAWTPGQGDEGRHFHTVLYSDPVGATCSSTQSITVRPCPQYGQACSAGIGACQQAGIMQCLNGNVMCSAVAGTPAAEMCNGVDDDCDGIVDNTCDTDNDGIFDPIEDQYGTNKNDADSDDDGLLDGDEIDPDLDTDGDGLINALDPDSDEDGLFDGTEAGRDCNHPDTAAAAMHCIADADAGATKTDVLVVDTDGGSKSDGDEDTNKNGKVDVGEKNPLDPSDDLSNVIAPCDGKADCNDNTNAAKGSSLECDCRISSSSHGNLPGLALLMTALIAIRRRRAQ